MNALRVSRPALTSFWVRKLLQLLLKTCLEMLSVVSQRILRDVLLLSKP